MKASTYQQYGEWTRQPGEEHLETSWKARALGAERELLVIKAGIQPDLHRATLELSILEAFNAWQESVPTSGHFWVPRLSRAMYAMRALVQTNLEDVQCG